MTGADAEGRLSSEANKAQIELWNGRVGAKWAALAANMDAVLADVTAALKARAGFGRIAIAPFDFPFRFATEGGAEAAVRMVMQIGPAASALAGASNEAMAAAATRLAAAFAPYDRNGVVALDGAIWLVEAFKPG